MDEASRAGRAPGLTQLARLALASALTIVAALPFLAPAPTLSIDGPLHLYRLVELDHCISLGQILPRWAPDLAQGYGFPLFNFYPPLAYYVAELWHLLGFSLARSLNLAFLVAAVLAGASMYLLARDWAGETGAVLAALLYVYAPYALYNSVSRGGLAEVLAWGLAPLVLWAFRRLALTSRPRWLVLASLSYAAFLLAHHLSALTFTPLLALFVAGQALERRSWKALGYPLLALALGIGVSAFFTLPAFFERGYVQIQRLFAAGFDYHDHFVSWRSLLAGPSRTDVSRMNPQLSRPVGWIQLGMAVLGSLAVLAVRPKQWRWYLGALAAAVALLFMLQSPSAPVWEALSLAKYLQFPWRLLAPLSLVLAFLGSGVGLVLSEGRRGRGVRPALTTAVALGLFFYCTPLLYQRPLRLPSPNPSVADLLEFERTNWLPSLTSNYDYLPVWVEQLPAESPMAAQYAASAPVTWLDAQSLPEGARVEQAQYGLNDMQFTFDSPVPFQALINQYYFPGWRAYVDGAAATVTPVAPHGLIGVDLPAGAHQLRLRFEDTPLRRVAGLISLASALALAVAAWAGQRSGKGWPKVLPGDGALGKMGWMLLLAATASFVVLKVAWLDRKDTWFKVTSLRGSQVTGMQAAVQANLGNEMLLLGCNLPTQPVPAGEPLAVRLYWKALRRMSIEYSTSVQLVDGQGRELAHGDSWHPGGYPTVRWDSESYNVDQHNLDIPPGTPPGEYWLRAGVYVPSTLKGLDVLDANGTPSGTSAVVGKVQVSRPAQPPAPASLGMLETLAVPMNEDLELLGYNPAPASVRPGQRVHLTLFWRATRRPQADYQAVVLLEGADGKVLSETAWPVAGTSYPTSAWEAGEVIRGEYNLLIPAESPAGATALQVTLSEPGGTRPRAVSLGELEVASIPHRMDIPRMQVNAGANLGDAISLLGYDLDRHEVKGGEAIHLTLYWQARAGMQQEYTVFTHLLDGTGKISAQHDGVPGQGERPTTSWVAGEVIVDEHELVVKGDAATGEHWLEIGMYEPVSGQRLSISSGSGEPQGDYLLLCAVQVR